nr:MAG TPA: hypothetical protein [Caudoviricetes sp.]
MKQSHLIYKITVQTYRLNPLLKSSLWELFSFAKTTMQF